jgi:Zinc carboxypeptidase
MTSSQKWDDNFVPTKRRFYTLSFSYTFNHSNDIVFFSYCLPYTVTRLQNTLRSLAKSDSGVKYMRRTLLGRSLAGNRIEAVTITDRSVPDEKKRFAVVTARTHPGETSGSFAVEGLLKWLLSDEGNKCRRTFSFKIIPMINPDGVVNGNYRCSLAGVDLNRVWESATLSSHPEVFTCRKFLFKLKEEGDIALFADFHSHSKQLGWFSYGCMPKEGTVRAAFVEPQQVMVMPHLFSELDPKRFKIDGCSFAIAQSKEQTARVMVHNRLNIAHCFTIESSAAGIAEYGGIRHFDAADYLDMGVIVGKAMLQRSESRNEHRGYRAKLDSLVKHFINKDPVEEDSDSDQDDLISEKDLVNYCKTGKYPMKVKSEKIKKEQSPKLPVRTEVAVRRKSVQPITVSTPVEVKRPQSKYRAVKPVLIFKKEPVITHFAVVAARELRFPC